MPARRPVKRSFLAQCACDLADLVGCGLLWIALGGLALLQIWLLLAGELRLPDALRDRLQSQLAARGLRADYDGVLIDPTGTLLVQRLRLHTTTGTDPIVTADTLLVRLDPWELLTGDISVDSVEGSGINLYVPAYLSPSGRAEAVLADAQFRLRVDPASALLTLDGLSGHIARVPVALDGELTLPALKSGGTGARQDFTAYYPLARRLVTIGEQLRPLGDFTVRGRFSPGRVDLTARATSIDLAQLPATPLTGLAGRAGNATLHFLLPLSLTGRPVASATLESLDLTLPDLPALSAGRVQARLTGAVLTDWRDWSAFTLEANAGTLAATPFTLEATGLQASVLPDGRLSTRLLTRIDSQPWQLDYTGRPRTGEGVVNVRARPTAGLLENLETFIPSRIPLTTLLALGPPPDVQATVVLAADGKPRRVTGRLAGTEAVAYHVPISEASGEFTWEGAGLTFDNILLRINDSEARGSYRMDIGTRDFRFLLAGRLDPPDIGGWFKGWWTRFWSDFDFSSPVPADVGIQGRWGDPYGTTVFVAANGRDAGLRGQPLDVLRTRLFIRPGWYDALDFYARDHDGREADGRFGLSMDPQGGSWRSLDFDLDSTLTTDALVKLLGPAAAPIFAPYTFTEPPRIDITGVAEAGGRRDLRFTARTEQPFLFAGFGVESIDVTGRMIDQVLTLEPMHGRVAGGALTGRAIVSGPDDARSLTLDHRVDNAELNKVLDLLAARQAKPGEPSGPPPRRPGGTLDIDIRATGPLTSPELLDGAGHAEIKGAHFAEISLLGILSEIFKSTGIGFTSLSLENLSTDYRLEQGMVHFPNLKLTGPSAAVEANGRYLLANGRLDFRAKLYPYQSQGGMLASAAGFVLSPLSNALEFHLVGTLEKPEWSFSYGPGSWFKGSPKAPEDTTTPASPTSGK